jgi:hypothetical protein
MTWQELLKDKPFNNFLELMGIVLESGGHLETVVEEVTLTDVVYRGKDFILVIHPQHVQDLNFVYIVTASGNCILMRIPESWLK